MKARNLFSRRRAALPVWSLIAGCALLLPAILLGGCGGSSSNSSPTPTPTSSGGVPDRGTGVITPQPNWTTKTAAYQQNSKKWTFLVYLNGANDLEEFGSLNVNQMEQVGSTKDINIVVQFKRIKGYDTGNGDWQETRRYYIQKDNNSKTISSLLLSNRADADMGDWHTLNEFVAWGVKTYPADRYCLVLWNHGAGWRSVNIAKGGRGVSYDDDTDHHIDTIQIPQAIDLGPILGSGRKWDVLAFDASLMQMLEVSYEIRDKVQFIAASEESPPGEGYPYQLFLADLAANPGISGRDFAIDIAQQTYAGYQQNYPGKAGDITQSALDASKIADIVPAVNDLGRALYNVRGTYRDGIITAREVSENYAYSYYHDLLDFTRRLTEPIAGTTGIPVPDAAVQSAAARVNQTVKAAVISNAHGDNHPHSNGLSIFLPSPSEYDNIDYEQAQGFGQRFSALAFPKVASDWQNFLISGPQ